MKCPYIKPIPVQCLNCQLPDCIRDERQDNRDNYNRYRAENLDKERERDRNRRSAEKERRNTYNRDYYWKNKVKRQAYYKAWNEKKKGNA